MILKRLIRRPVDDWMACAGAIARAGRPARSLAAMLLGFTAGGFAYVPIHELLHALGCVATGGTVSRLEIDPLFGGELLARIFPFVVPGGEYAGRLSGFETYGSDWVYLATDAAPFLLTVGVGVPLVRLCGRRARPFLFGAAAVLAYAPFYSLPGDYFEMASILTTRVAGLAATTSSAFESFRSDDVFRLLTTLFGSPAELGVEGPGDTALAGLLIGCSLVLAVALAFGTYALGGVVARAFSRDSGETPSTINA